MKNLSLYEVYEKKLQTKYNYAVCFGHDEASSSNEPFVCSYNLIVANLNEFGEIKWKQDLQDIVSPENLPLNITFLSLLNTVCVGFSNGELCTVSDAGSKCDLVGICDQGLLALEWSPDQELLVLVTKDLNNILMSCTYDPIHEVNLLSQEFGDKQFITVGWGKKETQFHGSAGKQAAKIKTEITPDNNILEDNTVKITWRGDGQFYAIGFIMDGVRRFKVFNREGELQYTSEKTQGMQSNICWRPSGNVIATTQRLPDKHVVAFFEKNGLKHGDFVIPVTVETKVTDLSWSTDSEILSLLCEDPVENTQKILIFTTGNYHWYLKQVLNFSPAQKINKLLWDNDFDIVNNKKLHVFMDDGQLLTYNWIWNVDHSAGKCSNDNGVVAVIDGSKILVTGFKQTVIPPPMAAFEIEFDSFVNSIHFAPTNKLENQLDPNSFFVCTCDGRLVFCNQVSKMPLKYEISYVIDVEKYSIPFQYFNWLWVTDDTVCCIKLSEYSYNLLEYKIEYSNLTLINSCFLPELVTRSHLHPTENTKIILQLLNGEILEYNLSDVAIPLDVTLPNSCPRFSVINIENELYFFSLSHKGNFYVNGDMIMNNVNSYFIHTNFLLLTTLKHTLLCTELTKTGINAIKEHQKNESAHVYSRKVERGSKLLLAVPNDTRTILQMPRGNLETIQPRPLSLRQIGNYLDELKYFEAFDLMRKQRINLNLIYDHDPVKFTENVETFLESIKNNSWLSLFLSDLENVDVTKTMYSSSYVNKNNTNNNDYKIGKVCDLIREHLSKRSDSDGKVLPILTSYVKKNTIEDIEKALLIIKELKLQEAAGSKLPVGSDEALKYLLYMVDVNHLFDVALGTYDFDLVLLVANKSQKDPKEFIPMLNELNEMEEDYKRFNINKTLKRFDRAVQCLVKCGPDKYNELRTFVKYHSLYRKALELFSPEKEIFRQIADDFGSYLKLKKQFTDAGIIFRRAQSIEKAVECFKDALQWELAIELALEWPKEKFTELCWEMITGLKEEKRHIEAITILERYYQNIDETISYAVECGQYKTALRLCSHHKKELKEKTILPALLEEHEKVKELIKSNHEMFIRHRDRLFVVRENKSKVSDDLYDPSYNNKDSDLYSDAGSTIASSSSRHSSRSYRSSKNRRKHERKVASLKEGSQYEDVALVIALYNLVVNSFELRVHVRELNIALCCCQKDNEAHILQTSLEMLLKDMKDSFRDIWTNEFVLEATNATIAAQNVPEGASVVLQGIATLEPHLRIAPVIQDTNWKLEGLE